MEKEEAVSGYYYLNMPNYPVIKDKPNNLLILSIGFVFGLLISILYVVVKLALSKIILRRK